MIRVVHADDHPVVRAGLALVLANSGDFNLLAQADDGERALALIERHQPDVAVLDISMPNLSGLKATPRIKKIAPKTRVLIVSVHEHRHYGIRAITAGANGYMHKGAPATELCEAIRKVHAGKRAMPEHLRDLETLDIQSEPTLNVWELSRREQEVFYLLADCNNSHEAAKELGVSIKTVDSHRGQILRKLGLRNNAELTRFAIAQGLVKA